MKIKESIEMLDVLMEYAKTIEDLTAKNKYIIMCRDIGTNNPTKEQIKDWVIKKG